MNLRRLFFVLLSAVMTVTTVSGTDVFAELDESIGTPRFQSLVADALATAETVDQVDRLARDYVSQIVERDTRVSLLLQAGSRFELAHRFDEAKRYYLEARQLDPQNGLVTIRLAGVLIEQGSSSEAIIILTNAMQTAETRKLQRYAAILRSRANFYTGNTDQAVIHLRSLTGMDAAFDDETLRHTVEPAAYALLAEIALIDGRDDLYEEVFARMKRIFPKAPETQLVARPEPGNAQNSRQARITYYPSPSRIASGIAIPDIVFVPVDRAVLEEGRAATAGPGKDETAAKSPKESPKEPTKEPPETARPKGIQTGSFRDPENAQYMARDIRNYGFEAQVREVAVDGKTFFRVIVPIPADSTDPQELIVALKERGVEGFMIF